MEAERQGVLIRYSGLSDMTRFTFQTLNPDGRGKDPTAQRLFRTTLAICKSYAEQPKGWLVLTGSSGTGKTHLAAAIAHAAIERGQLAFFVTVADLLDRLRSSFSPNSDLPYDDLSERIRNTPLLILDDMGAHGATPWAQEKLLQLINHRYNLLLPTVITVSTPLERLDERIRSRLTDAAVTRLVEVGRAVATETFCLPANIEGSLAALTFESFFKDWLTADAPERVLLVEALDACKKFAGAAEKTLVISGATGRCNHHLAAAIFDQRKRSGMAVGFVDFPALIGELRDALASSNSARHDQVVQRAKDCTVLIVDDVGAFQMTPWAIDRLSDILRHRLAEKLPTVVTTQLPFDRLFDELPQTIGTRLRDISLAELWVTSSTKREPPTPDRPPRRSQGGDSSRRPRT